MQDLQGGRIDFLCEIISTAKPQIDGGTVKAIAIMTKDRSAALPNLPTAEEQGTKGMEAYTWNAIFLPKDTPAPIVKKLADAANQAMETPAVKERLAALGATWSRRTAVRRNISQKFVKNEIAKWREPILQERRPDRLTADVKNSTAADRPVRRCFSNKGSALCKSAIRPKDQGSVHRTDDRSSRTGALSGAR